MQITTADLGSQLKVDYDAATVPECLVAKQPVGVAYAAAIVQVQLILLLTVLVHSALMLVVQSAAPV